MISKKFFGRKRAISPVVATILLISLVVAAGSMVYFLVIPMLKGTASLELTNAQWFDSNGDQVADTVYITVINSGTARAIVKDIQVTIDTPTKNETVITNAQLADQTFPLEMDVSFRAELVMKFDPTDYVELGSNVFRLKVIYNEDNVIFAPENLKYTAVIEPLSLDVLNPANGSWCSGIIDPQAIKSGGFKASVIKYNFSAPDGTPLLTNITYTQNIDSTAYADGYNYTLTFYVWDYFGTLVSKTVKINIDNTNPVVSLSLNGSTFQQGQGVDISWTVTGIDTTSGDSPLINQTLTLTGTTYAGRTLYTDDGSTAQDGVPQSPYDLSGTETIQMKEDTYTVTIYVKDSSGNTASSGQDFFLQDSIVPNCYIITPTNDSTITGDLVIQVYADDVSGINTDRFTIDFIDPTSGSIEATYSQQGGGGGSTDYNGTATYNSVTKTWNLIIPSVILPNKLLFMAARVYDDSSALNSNTTSVYILVQNIIIEGVSASLPYKSWNYYNYLTFFIKNNYIDTITIDNITVTWNKAGLTGYYYVYSYTSGAYWLDYNRNLYDNATTYDTTASATMDAGSIHQLLITFPWGQDLRNSQLEIVFKIQGLVTSEKIIITIDSAGDATITTVLV